MSDSPLTPIESAFILHWGQMGEKWGLNRTVAQIHALLYLRSAPMDAEAITRTLSVARSNVSTSLKELQEWNLVKKVHVLGDRKDRFCTDSDPWALFMTIMEGKWKREMEPTLALLAELSAKAAKDNGESPVARERIAAMSDMVSTLGTWYASARSLPRPAFEAFLRAGSGLAGLVSSLKGRKK